MTNSLPPTSATPGTRSAAGGGTTSAANRRGPVAGRAAGKDRRRRGLVGRVVRAVGYGVMLVPMGVGAMVGAVVGRGDGVHERWRRLGRFLGAAEAVRLRRPGRVALFLHGFSSLVLGVVCWFLVMMLVLAVVRGPFYGFVEHGPYGPGTWGGPTKAGAWAAHAAIAVPLIPLLGFGLRGIALLQAATVRRLYGSRTAWWTIPVTAALTLAGLVLLYSWTQQV
ncbi:hypothetical protein EV648_11489 [Kribbella sp. VKM Ac-2568]|nr:hypothetical protein EV648_11489 [Kribbella sp. VKM Ac-2568]